MGNFLYLDTHISWERRFLQSEYFKPTLEDTD